ncbi:MAG: bestrophin family ion channel, partial [Acinetobacter sp.]
MRRFSYLRLSQAAKLQVLGHRFGVDKFLFQPPPWLALALRLRGSVVPAILSEVLFCGGFGVLVTAVDFYLINVHWPVLGSLIPSIVLGLLLVFRTNTAYERFWEGRRQWGNI